MLLFESEILINSNFNYIPAAQVQYTDVTRPFTASTTNNHQKVSGVKGSATPDYMQTNILNYSYYKKSTN